MNKTESADGIKNILITFGEYFGVVVTGVIIGIWGKFSRDKSKEIKKENNRLSLVVQHTQVNEILTELRVLIRCSRCLVFQYHNGGKFADGTSIKRFSITHESITNGVQSMIIDSQDVLTTRYLELIKIIEDRPDTIIFVDSLPECSLRSALEINSVVCFSFSPLKCLDNITPMGFVCCHWCSIDEIDSIKKDGVNISEIEEIIEDKTKVINNHITYNNVNKIIKSKQ